MNVKVLTVPYEKRYSDCLVLLPGQVRLTSDTVQQSPKQNVLMGSPKQVDRNPKSQALLPGDNF